jgi:hypothetical protein
VKDLQVRKETVWNNRYQNPTKLGSNQGSGCGIKAEDGPDPGVNAPKEYKVNPTCSRKKIACKASALLAFDLCCWVFMAAASCLLC